MPSPYQVFLLHPGQGDEPHGAFSSVEQAKKNAEKIKSSHPNLKVVVKDGSMQIVYSL